MMIVPQVRLKPATRNALFPVAVMIDGMSEPRIVSLRDTTAVSEKKIDSVARVTMNGGRLTRVTSQPLNAPIAVPRMRPMMRAGKPGTPSFVAMLAIRIDENTVMAPAERSMPAVRMTRVWPSASVAITVTCCSTRPRFAADRNRPLTIANAMIATTSTASGPRIGLACRTCWMRLSADSDRWSSKPEGALGGAVAVSPVSVAMRALLRQSRSGGWGEGSRDRPHPSLLCYRTIRPDLSPSSWRDRRWCPSSRRRTGAGR